MNSSPNRASNPAGKPRRKPVTLDLSTARQMLPLVRSIVTDIVDTNRRLAELAPQQEMLDDARRNLTWQSRQRRYAVHEEVANVEKHVPREYITPDGFGITTACRRYLEPLIAGEDYPPYRNGLPDYAELKLAAVPKKLAKGFVV